MRGQIQYILMEFRPLYCIYTWFRHELHDWHSGSDGKNPESIALSLCEILPVNFSRPTVSVSCSYWRQTLHILSGSEAIENAVNLPQWAAEFGKLAHGIWKNLLRKTVVFSHCGKWHPAPVTCSYINSRTWPLAISHYYCCYFPGLCYCVLYVLFHIIYKKTIIQLSYSCFSIFAAHQMFTMSVSTQVMIHQSVFVLTYTVAPKNWDHIINETLKQVLRIREFFLD